MGQHANYHLEVCSFTVETCRIAEEVGAARIELCDNPLEGGTTPSYGVIKRAREAVSIQLFPIIRPRSRDYFYDDDEWQAVIDDIKMCKELGCDGISVGAQKITGEIDAGRRPDKHHAGIGRAIRQHREADG